MKTNGAYIIIPVFNEEKILKSTIQSLHKLGYKKIIVIDDGSTDQTLAVIKKTRVLYLHHRVNRGKGAALKTGFAAARLMKAQAIVTMDGDGQHNPKDIKKMLSKINKEYDVVLGNRMADRKNMPFLRIFANYLANIVTWFSYGLWVQDSQGGLRAYSEKALSAIDIYKDAYEYDSEIIRELAKKKLRFCEVPVTANYTMYSQEKRDKQSLVKGLFTAVKLLIDEEI